MAEGLRQHDIHTGWLAPDGTFFPCEVYGHYGMAYELVEKYQLKERLKRAVPSPDNALLDNGWIHITLSQLGVKEWQMHFTINITPEQKQFLQPYLDGKYWFPVERSCRNEIEEYCRRA